LEEPARNFSDWHDKRICICVYVYNSETSYVLLPWKVAAEEKILSKCQKKLCAKLIAKELK
jgi:hypothetical protein